MWKTKLKTRYADIPREVEFVVYKNISALRAAATRYDNHYKHTKDKKLNTNSDTLGICHSFEIIDENGNVKPQTGIVRVAIPHTGGGVVSHEIAHAVIHMCDISESSTLMEAGSQDNEDFAWTLGDLVRQAFNFIYYNDEIRAHEENYQHT